MIPTPTVRKVEPCCAECKGTEDLIGQAPRYVCRSCLRTHVRLMEIARSHDDDVREGWR